MSASHAPAPARVDADCRALQRPGRRAAAERAELAARHNPPDPAWVAACREHELEVRRARRRALSRRLARLPAHKTLDTFDFSALPELSQPQVLALANGGFGRRHEKVICSGPPGTGKTHVAIALALGALQAGLRVRFLTAVTRAPALLLAEQEYRLPRYRKRWQPIARVVLDEVGYLGLGPGGPLRFQFCAERSARGSLLLPTHLAFGRWTAVFSDVLLTAALLDRLTHHAHVLPFQGSSYRVRTRALASEEG
jgi:DNA replication protein DnaC